MKTLITFLLFVHSAWPFNEYSGDVCSLTQVLQENTENLASKLDLIATELGQEKRFNSQAELKESISSIQQELGALKSKLQAWKETSQQEMSQLQSQVGTHDVAPDQITDQLKLDFEHLTITLQQELLALKRELEALKQSRTEDKDELLAENSRLRNELQEMKQALAIARNETLTLTVLTDLAIVGVKERLKMLNQSHSQSRSELGKVQEIWRNDLSEVQEKIDRIFQTGIDQCESGEVSALCEGMRNGSHKLELCPTGWLMYPNSTKCIKWFPEELDFLAASQHCKGQGANGHLLSIHTMDQIMFMRTDMDAPGYNFWIGFNDIERKGYFTWTDGSSAVLKYFMRAEGPVDENGRPLNGYCTSMAMPPHFIAYPVPCDKNLPFICQIEKTTQVVTY